MNAAAEFWHEGQEGHFMYHLRAQTRGRLLALAAAAAFVGLLAGCQQLNLFPVRPPERTERPDPPRVSIARPRVAPPVDAAALPSKCQYRLGQYLFLADFEIKRDMPVFKELTDLRENVHRTLQLPQPSSGTMIQVYLFEDRDRYERFMAATHPDLPRRRAFFVAQPHLGGDDLLVYVFWGDGERIQQDLRHELTHALLHSVLKDVPLWLDEGLAEYFELPPANRGVNPDHIKHLMFARYDLGRLEQLTEVEQMTTAEYREAWAWVHLMLNTSEETRKVLIGYLRELRQTRSPGALRARLVGLFPEPELILTRHLQQLDAARAAATAAK
jgi:hypothetical protein